jgi:hypothetical protein
MCVCTHCKCNTISLLEGHSRPKYERTPVEVELTVVTRVFGNANGGLECESGVIYHHLQIQMIKRRDRLRLYRSRVLSVLLTSEWLP